MTDLSGFSPSAQRHIREYEEIVAASRLVYETDLEYLRRTRPDMSEDSRLGYMFMSIVGGKPVRTEQDLQLREQAKAKLHRYCHEA